jgi:uncharacterized repeat protein (TIGR04138 family)
MAMSDEATQQQMLERIERLAATGNYRLEAYDFLMRSLDYTMRTLGQHRHVSGGELVDGIQAYGKQEFGPLAKHVLNTWGIFNTRDFGEIVFRLVEQGILKKTDEDRIDDFVDRFDFGQAFERDYYRDRPVFQD